MTSYTIDKDWPDTITFDRLHALAKRGYRATLGADRDDSGFARIELFHPRTKGAFVPPRITLWSNGIVATCELLWPSRHVPQEHAPEPAWQKVIDVNEEETFDNFVKSVPMPTWLDIYAFPLIAQAKCFLARLLFATTICLGIAVIIMLAQHVIRA